MTQTFFLPIEQVFTNLGAIGAGFKLSTFETGTTTPLATFSDTALTVANPNPTIADSAGRFVQMFFNDAKLYKAVLKDADDNTIWTADPVDPKIFSLNDFDPRPTSFWGTTAGTSSAYTLAANPTLVAYANTNTFLVAIHIACAAAPTMTIDGLTALNMKKANGAGGKTALEANDLVVATYVARNDGTDIVILNPEIREKATFNTAIANTLIIPVNAELTIVSGEITVTDSRHTVDTEADAATDDLDTINGLTTGQRVTFSIDDNARTVVFKHGTGNIITSNAQDITVRNTNRRVIIEYDGTNAIVTFAINKGDIIHTEYNTTATYTNASTTDFPVDDTKPQSNEGTEILTQAITPTDTSNTLEIEALVHGTNPNTAGMIALFQDSTADSLSVAGGTSDFSNINNLSISVPLRFRLTPAGTTSSTTFKIRASNFFVNGGTSARLFGGASISSLKITEIQT